jgi:nitrogen fixation/metabolism regulation signal transduction histidine kinase
MITSFKNFRFQNILRITLICFNCFFLFYLLSFTQFYITAGLFFLLILIQIFSFITYIEKSNKKLTQFLEAVRYSDFSTSFSEAGLGKSFDELNKAFNEVFDAFRATRELKEEHFQYLQTVVQHVNVGLMVINSDGKIELINRAASLLLKCPHLKHINELDNGFPSLKEIIIQKKQGDEQLLKLLINNQILQLSVKLSCFVSRGKELTLISIQNITHEMEEKEMESWQKLIRVLTHEIMNSLTPIITLASTANQILGVTKPDNLDEETYRDLNSAIATIERRAEGLLKFVEAYRHLTKIPKPQFTNFSIQQLTEEIYNLLYKKFEQNKVMLKTVSEESLMLTGDKALIEQVLINLLANSLEACVEKENAEIELRTFKNESGRICISVIDNGKGIEAEMIDKIFIPFFTSKSNGSGIGLSLSRQIMRLHKGSISVNSKPGIHTAFILQF